MYSRIPILLVLATLPRYAEGGEALKGMLAPDLGFNSDLAKLQAQIDGFKGGDVLARVERPPERNSASDNVPAAIAPGPPRPRSFFIVRAMPPVVLGAAAAAFALRSQVVQRAERRLEAELSALACEERACVCLSVIIHPRIITWCRSSSHSSLTAFTPAHRGMP